MGCPNEKMPRAHATSRGTGGKSHRANDLLAGWLREDGHRCVKVYGRDDTALDWCMRAKCTGTRNTHAPRHETDQERRTRMVGEFERGNTVKADALRRRGHACVTYGNRTPLEVVWCGRRTCTGQAKA